MFGVWCLVFDVWCLVSGVWCSEFEGLGLCFCGEEAVELNDRGLGLRCARRVEGLGFGV